jgi:hypothetical protein
MLLISPVEDSETLGISFVALISYNILKFKEFPFGLVPEDVDIRPLASRKRAIVANIMTSHNTDINLVGEGSTTKLEGLVFSIERRWFLDAKVNTINAHKRSITDVTDEPVLPSDLYQKQRTTTMTNGEMTMGNNSNNSNTDNLRLSCRGRQWISI